MFLFFVFVHPCFDPSATKNSQRVYRRAQLPHQLTQPTYPTNLYNQLIQPTYPTNLTNQPTNSPTKLTKPVKQPKPTNPNRSSQLVPHPTHAVCSGRYRGKKKIPPPGSDYQMVKHHVGTEASARKRLSNGQTSCWHGGLRQEATIKWSNIMLARRPTR